MPIRIKASQLPNVVNMERRPPWYKPDPVRSAKVKANQRKSAERAKQFEEICNQSCDVLRPHLEYRFHETRKWRWDFAWPHAKLAMEVQGGIFIAGGHNRGRDMMGDYEKENTAACMGWRVLHVTPRELLTEATLALVRAALTGDGK